MTQVQRFHWNYYQLRNIWINFLIKIRATTDVRNIVKKAELFHYCRVDQHSQKHSALTQTKLAPPTQPKPVPTACLWSGWRALSRKHTYIRHGSLQSIQQPAPWSLCSPAASTWTCKPMSTTATLHSCWYSSAPLPSLHIAAHTVDPLSN